ncbi:NADH-cytochrome b5 reductase 2 [Polytolypa hystricis UAMH7299]|uniref:NADH-cytochrome b5 reductase n=1 Tax=Polytolypa hystricis (strain UAMH7299) TaxID=1447883 RepID=A0A2B7WVS7_POLH7|nr:NADH-cytochrome b5 reductase 2 [Polytolypa hystricis UAMH7299]
MFAHQVFRSAQPLRQAGLKTFARQASSQAAQPQKSKAPVYAGAALAAAAGAGFWFWQQQTSEVTKIADKDRAKVFTGGDQGWVDLKLAQIETVSHNTKKFRFEFEDSEAVSGLHIASALLTKFKDPKNEKPTLRPYTPISDESEPGYLDLLVKAYPNGPMSQHLHNMEVGQTLNFKGPLPKYTWEANKHDHVCMVAGGTGITPMYQLIRKIFNDTEDKTAVTLVYGNVAKEDILLKKELDHLENTYPRRFRVFYLLDNPPPQWSQGTGYVTKELLKTVFPEPKSENLKVFVCGPPGLYKAVSGPKVSPKDQGELTGILKELGYTKEQVYKF